VGQPAGEEQTGARTDGGDGGDGDQESGGCEDEQEGGENKEREREREREDANNRRNRSSTGKRRPPAKNIVAVSPKKGICLDNPYPYLDNIQTPAVAPPPPRVLFGRTPSPLLAVGIRLQRLESRRDIEQTRAPHRQPGEHQGRSPSTSVNYGREWQTLPLLGLAGAIPPFTTTSTTNTNTNTATTTIITITNQLTRTACCMWVFPINQTSN